MINKICFKKRRTTFVEHPTGQVWSKFQLKSLSNFLKLWRWWARKNEMPKNGQNAKKQQFLIGKAIFKDFCPCYGKYFNIQLKYITIGMICKNYQHFQVTIAKVFRFRSLKWLKICLKLRLIWLKNGVNHRYVFQHNFDIDLNSKTNEPILERRKIGVQHMLK